MDRLQAVGWLGWLALAAGVAQTVVGWASGQSLAVPAAVTTLVGIAGRFVAWAYSHPDDVRPGGIVVALAMIVAGLGPALSNQPVPASDAPVPAVQPAVPVRGLPDVPADGDVGSGIPVGRGALLIVESLFPVGCSAAQQATVLDWLRAAAARLTPCLARCGLNAALDSARQALAVGSVDGSAIGFAAANCATACASQVGLAAIVTPATPPASGAREVAAPSYRILLVKPAQ